MCGTDMQLCPATTAESIPVEPHRSIAESIPVEPHRSPRPKRDVKKPERLTYEQPGEPV